MTDGEVMGGHQVRVQVRWLSQGDIWPTWHALVDHRATWADVLANNATWEDVLGDTGPALDSVDEDITCDVTGLKITRGRQSTVAHPTAATLKLTMLDPDGRHDPRIVPAGMSRTGARITVDVLCAGDSVWRPLFCGFVEEWRKEMTPEDVDRVEVDASDALHLLARAAPSARPQAPVGAGELSGARIERILDVAGWHAKWGTRRIDAGTVAMNPTLHGARVDYRPEEQDSTTSLLDEAHDVARSEDGLLDVSPSGEWRFLSEGWRDRVAHEVAFIDLTGNEPRPARLPVLCPARAPLVDSDLDIATRVEVSRSVEWDPDINIDPATGKGERPPEDIRKAENIQAVSRWGPIQPVKLRSLPHTTNTRSQQLADRWVKRLSHRPNVLAEATFIPSVHPAEARTLATLDNGSILWMVDDSPHVPYGRDMVSIEAIGVEHDITPDGPWRVTCRFDQWAGTLPAPQPVGAFQHPAFSRAFDTARI